MVFNPLPWPRTGLVDLTLPVPDHLNAVRLSDGSGMIPIVRTEEGKRRFLASDVPALGYRTYHLGSAAFKPPSRQADDRQATLENAFFKAAFDPARGTIRSLVDKRTGRELVDSFLAHGFGQYLYKHSMTGRSRVSSRRTRKSTQTG